MPKKTYNGVTYDTDTDYTLLIRAAAGRGDNSAAAQYERQRNAKIAGEGLKYAPTHDYAQYLPENRYRFDPGEDAAYAAAKQDMDRAFRALTEGGDFRYDPDSDPVYQAYAARYLRAGRNAMEDTLGRAAALTGGYGSTYAEGAAQQAYDAYLQRLNDVLPDLYGAAYRRHRDALSDKASRYAAAGAARAYDRAYAAWEQRVKLTRDDEADAARRYAEADSAAQSDAKAAQSRKSDLGAMILKTGYTPTDAQLKAAGMTRAEAEAWKAAYYRNLK